MKGKGLLLAVCFMLCLFVGSALAQEGYCTEIQLLPEIVNVGNPYQYVKTVDENGNDLQLPLRVLRGGAIASIQEGSTRKLMTTGTGTVVLMAENPDGTAVTREFEVYEKPEKVYLNAEELTLNIGDTFDFEVTFDRGKTDYQLNVTYDNHDPEGGLYCVKLQGNHLVAQAPGVAWVWVYCDVNDYKECRITVLDGKNKVQLVGPEGALGVGDACQMYVTDGHGKRYAATFRKEVVAGYDGENHVATLTPDGLLTGTEPGQIRVYATLADGRELQMLVNVVKKPLWINHPDMACPVNYGEIDLQTIVSDVGVISSSDVTVQVLDETIATFDTRFRLKKEGETKVLLTAKNGGATYTFTLTVERADDTLYPDVTILDVASGYSVALPKVRDYYGNEEKVTWKITHQSQSPAAGGVYPVAFRISGNRLYCQMTFASCTIEGTAKDGRTVRISGFAYRQANDVVFREDPFELYVGEDVQIDVSPKQDADGLGGYQMGPVQWTVTEGADVIEFTPCSAQTGMPTATGLKPGTAKIKLTMTTNGVSRTCTVVVKAQPLPSWDLNSDYAVNQQDASALVLYLAQRGNAIRLEAADIYPDGAVNTKDALYLMRYLNSLSVNE